MQVGSVVLCCSEGKRHVVICLDDMADANKARAQQK